MVFSFWRTTGSGIGQQDGVAIALRHLAAIGAGQLGRRGKQDIGLGKHFAAVELVEVVEAARHLARQLDMRRLVLADGHILRLVQQNVGRHQQRIAEKAVGGQILAGQILLHLLVAGHALEPAERSDHAEQQLQFGMLQNMALQKEHGFAGSSPAAR